MQNTCSTEGKRNILGQHRVKTFHPVGLNDKGGVLILTQKYLPLVVLLLLLLLLGVFFRILASSKRNPLISPFIFIILQFDFPIFIWSSGHFNLRTLSSSPVERLLSSIQFNLFI